MAGSLRYGVIGVGHLGKQHARVAASIPGVELVGLYDTDAGTLHRVASDLGVRPIATLSELVASVEAASVAVPTTSHFDVAMQCVAAGVHVLIEKPLAETVAQARVLVPAMIAKTKSARCSMDIDVLSPRARRGVPSAV